MKRIIDIAVEERRAVRRMRQDKAMNLEAIL